MSIGVCSVCFDSLIFRISSTFKLYHKNMHNTMNGVLYEQVNIMYMSMQISIGLCSVCFDV